MREVFLKKRDINHLDFVKRSALETDYDLFIEDDVIAIDEDTKQIIFVHKKLDFDDKQIMWALDRIKYEENTRIRNKKTERERKRAKGEVSETLNRSTK